MKTLLLWFLWWCFLSSTEQLWCDAQCSSRECWLFRQRSHLQEISPHQHRKILHSIRWWHWEASKNHFKYIFHICKEWCRSPAGSFIKLIIKWACIQNTEYVQLNDMLLHLELDYVALAYLHFRFSHFDRLCWLMHVENSLYIFQ